MKALLRIRLVVGLAFSLAVGSLGFIPSPASASTPLTVTATSSTTLTTVGSPVVLAGTVTSSGALYSGASMDFYGYWHDDVHNGDSGTAFTALSASTTGSDGAFSYSFTPTQVGRFHTQVNATGSGTGGTVYVGYVTVVNHLSTLTETIPATAASNTPATLTGFLVDSTTGTGIANDTISVLTSADSNPANFTTLDIGHTDGSGHFSIQETFTTNTYIELSYAGSNYNKSDYSHGFVTTAPQLLTAVQSYSSNPWTTPPATSAIDTATANASDNFTAGSVRKIAYQSMLAHYAANYGTAGTLHWASDPGISTELQTAIVQGIKTGMTFWGSSILPSSTWVALLRQNSSRDLYCQYLDYLHSINDSQLPGCLATSYTVEIPGVASADSPSGTLRATGATYGPASDILLSQGDLAPNSQIHFIPGAELHHEVTSMLGTEPRPNLFNDAVGVYFGASLANFSVPGTLTSQMNISTVFSDPSQINTQATLVADQPICGSPCSGDTLTAYTTATQNYLNSQYMVGSYVTELLVAEFGFTKYLQFMQAFTTASDSANDPIANMKAKFLAVFGATWDSFASSADQYMKDSLAGSATPLSNYDGSPAPSPAPAPAPAPAPSVVTETKSAPESSTVVIAPQPQPTVAPSPQPATTPATPQPAPSAPTTSTAAVAPKNSVTSAPAAPSRSANSAPVMTQTSGQSVSTKVSALPTATKVAISVNVGGRTVNLGSVKTSPTGTATLPTLPKLAPGTYLVQMTAANGQKYFVKIAVKKK